MHLFTITKLEYKAEHQMYNVNSDNLYYRVSEALGPIYWHTISTSERTRSLR